MLCLVFACSSENKKSIFSLRFASIFSFRFASPASIPVKIFVDLQITKLALKMYVIRLSMASVVARPRTGAHYGAHANAGLAELHCGWTLS
jgi:hypothetical protein